ncbi:unnamed protein product [Mucor hiemalis]
MCIFNLANYHWSRQTPIYMDSVSPPIFEIANPGGTEIHFSPFTLIYIMASTPTLRQKNEVFKNKSAKGTVASKAAAQVPTWR